MCLNTTKNVWHSAFIVMNDYSVPPSSNHLYIYRLSQCTLQLSRGSGTLAQPDFFLSFFFKSFINFIILILSSIFPKEPLPSSESHQVLHVKECGLPHSCSSCCIAYRHIH
uniref:Uncharacterized protein n=1 Tax=Anguilla anguilla TaxID=7936 RepID=A0A0E9WZV8_ANGAN